MSLNKIGITGCTGVLGKLLNEILSKKNVNFSCFKGDIKKIQDVNRWISNNQDLEKIFHFAALVPIYKVENDKMNALRTNLNGTKNLINSIKKNKLKVWFFFPSSCHVYKSKKTKIKETDVLRPISYYGQTKLRAENFLLQNKRKDIKVCIGRIFSFYHKRQKKPFLYPSIKERIKNYKKNENFDLRGGESIRDITNAKNIVNIIYMISKLNLDGIFNIGTGKGTKIKNFVKNLTNKKLKIKTTKKRDYLVANVNKLKKYRNINEYIKSL